MENIIGINEARPKLTSLIESLAKGASPVVLTVNSEPKSVLLNYEEYKRLRQAEKECKRLSLKLALEKARANATANGITENDVLEEVRSIRKQKKGSNHENSRGY
ncbi:MAG: type II toxin-antitoxin system Phd/YefM family antitoxin [Desulfotomaculaceae bacterium]|nr:type II toxin-antitoxin system Phd/YefM family antitoxin [Desulfotomaculaceae bacterium]